MRIKLTLVPTDKKCLIPINYQYPLSAAIYKILSSASPDYARFLHEKGYKSQTGKPLKLFTFSYLNIPDVKIQGKMLGIYGFPDCSLFISSPISDEFINNILFGLFDKQELAIGNKYVVGRFLVKQIESLPKPDFVNKDKFKCLSPFVISSMRPRNGRMMPYYLRPDDDNLGEAVRNNLIQKYFAIYNKLPENQNLFFKLNEDYIKKRGGVSRISKLITIKEHQSTDMTQIKAIFCPFTMIGSADLKQVAWEAGMGNYCSQGFGCIDIFNMK